MTGHKKAVVYPVAEGLCRHVRPAFHEGVFSDPLGRLEVQRLIMVHAVPFVLALLVWSNSSFVGEEIVSVLSY